MTSDPSADLFSSKMMGILLDSLKTIPFFHALDDLERKVIAKHMFFLEFNQGDVVFHEGASGDFVCFVVDGELEVLKNTRTGEERVISNLKAGNSIGEMSVIDAARRSATVQASTKTRVLTLTRNNFEKLVDKHPKIGVKLLKELARELSNHLRNTSCQLVDLTPDF